MDFHTFYQLLLDVVSYNSFGSIQFYGFLFLLGSFTVASLSDLKRMAAQKEFAEVWLFFTFTAFSYDFIRLSGELPVSVFLVKWTMLLLFALLSWRYIGFILSLSAMDLTAACAAMSLLNPMYILAYYLLLVILNLLFKPVLNKFGDGISIPFLPVILTATVAVLFLAKVNELADSLKGLLN